MYIFGIFLSLFCKYLMCIKGTCLCPEMDFCNDDLYLDNYSFFFFFFLVYQIYSIFPMINATCCKNKLLVVFYIDLIYESFTN